MKRSEMLLSDHIKQLQGYLKKYGDDIIGRIMIKVNNENRAEYVKKHNKKRQESYKVFKDFYEKHHKKFEKDVKPVKKAKVTKKAS